MTHNPDLDPEVVADLQLRAATERDSTRSRPTTLRYEPCPTVRVLPCAGNVNGKPCGHPCELTQTGQARLTQFAKMLLSRGEQPLDEHKLLMCDRCRALWESQRADRKRERVEEMRTCIQQLKASKDAEQEYDLWRRVEALHHPDPRGLREALRAKSQGSMRPRAKEGL